MIYFDNAATSYPKPLEVFESMLKFMQEFGGNPGRAGHRMATGAEAMIGQARNAVSKFFGLNDPARCVFTLNCSDALNMAIKGVLRGGEHVVTTALEHNSINRPLQQMADDGFIMLTRVVPSEPGAWHTDEILAAITPKTRLVALTHCANATGVINPVEELGPALRKKSEGITLLVDAAQSAGVVPLDMEAAQIDLLAFPGHKALYGPTGTGALLISSRFDEKRLKLWREGGTGGDSTNPHQPDELPHRLEGGTPNTMGIAGLLAGVRFLNRIASGRPEATGGEQLRIADCGLRIGAPSPLTPLPRGGEGDRSSGQDARTTVLEHERAIVARLIGELEGDARFTIFGTKDVSRKVGALSITIKDRDNAEVASILDQAFSIAVRPGLHCAPYAHRQLGTFPNGTVRLSPGYFNTIEEAEQVVKALKEIA
ncbi:MAG TPA: aminotransferase class V-fold PLP-dependent enzyme [Planctomycetota bacterium]|jgi:selenocysteine lyase/cysteine desulfurase